MLAKEGVAVPMADLFGVAGRVLLVGARLAPAYRARIESLLELVDTFDRQVEIFEREVRTKLAGHAGYQATQQIPGVGETLAALFVAEIGDVKRFSSPAHLCSWAGLTPRHCESDTTLHRGPITKQGSRLVRSSRGRSSPTSGKGHQAPERLRPDQRQPRRHLRSEEGGPGGCGKKDPHARLLRLARRHPPLQGYPRRRERDRAPPGA